MILILDHRSDSQPIAPLLLTPEPRLRKCTPQICLQRLGVYVPLPQRGRLAAGVTQRIAPGGAPTTVGKTSHDL
jgi:hypothetical protein